MIQNDFEKPHQIEPLPLWKYQGLARDIENAKKEITEHLNVELKRFQQEIDKMKTGENQNEKSPSKTPKRKA